MEKDNKGKQAIPYVFIFIVIILKEVGIDIMIDYVGEFINKSISIFLIGMLAGLVIQDLFHGDSWIWHLFRKMRSVYVIKEICPAHFNDGEKEWLEITVHLEFIKSVKNFYISFLAHYNIKNKKSQEKFIIQSEKYDWIAKGDVKKYVIAIIPLRRSKKGDSTALGYQCWGNKYRESGEVDGVKLLSDNTHNLIEICGETRIFYCQSENIYMNILNKERMEFGRFYISDNFNQPCISVSSHY